MDSNRTVADPRTIYQDALDRMSAVFWARDWQTLRTLVRVPTRFRTLDADLTVTTIEDAVASSQSLRESYARIGATEYHRICTRAAFTSPAQDEIFGIHTTHALNGGSHVIPAYPAAQFIRLETGVWKSFDLTVRVRNRDVTLVDPALALAEAERRTSD